MEQSKTGKIEFPLFKTKVKGLNRAFNLTNPREQEEYFEAKIGKEIAKLQKYLSQNTFIAYFLGKKNAGKGTYSKMFARLVGPEHISHVAIGDIVRDLDSVIRDPARKKELLAFLEKSYRGWVSLDDIISSLESRSTQSLLPTELILALVKEKIAKSERKAIFLDGFPRTLDQISYSLFFRDLVGYRDDPDFFTLINVPTSVIDERIKWRRICPMDQTSRNLKLLSTSKVGYKKDKKEFYLICDHPDHGDEEIEMVPKEGDELGTEPIKERLKMDAKLMEQAFNLHGIPKILLRNTVPQNVAHEYIDDYEITPEYVYKWNEEQHKVEVIEKPWVIKDDEGISSYSLMPQAVVVSLIKQMVQVLGL